MKNVRKASAFLLVLVMCLSMLSGCGGNGGNGGGDSQPVGESSGAGGETEAADNGNAGSEDDSEEPYELVVELMCFGSTPTDIDAVTEAVNEITLPAINATVKFLTVAVPDHATKMSLLSAGGEKMDLVAAGGPGVNPANLVRDGVLTDITDMLDNVPYTMERLGDLAQVGTFGGRVYSILGSFYPGRKDCLIYNADMAEEYGIEIPDSLDTWDDWDAFLAECKSKLPEGVYPLTLGDGGASNHWNFGWFDSMGDDNYLTYGVLPDIENGTEVVNWYATDQYREVVEKKREWYEAGYCVPDSMTSGFTANDCMQAGTCFAEVSALSVNKNEANPAPAISINSKCIVLSDSYISSGPIYIYNWGIPVTSENPEKVLQFIELMNTNADLANILNYGIEGREYVKVEEDGKVITYAEGVDSSNVGWNGYPNWFGDNAECYIMTPNTEQYYDLISEYSIENSKPANCLGYTFDSSSMKTQLASIQTVIDTYRPSLECGMVDVDTELPKFLQELEDAGMSEVVAENQRQFDEWLSTR